MRGPAHQQIDMRIPLRRIILLQRIGQLLAELQRNPIRELGKIKRAGVSELVRLMVVYELLNLGQQRCSRRCRLFALQVFEVPPPKEEHSAAIRWVNVISE